LVEAAPFKVAAGLDDGAAEREFLFREVDGTVYLSLGPFASGGFTILYST